MQSAKYRFPSRPLIPRAQASTYPHLPRYRSPYEMVVNAGSPLPHRCQTRTHASRPRFAGLHRPTAAWNQLSEIRHQYTEGRGDLFTLSALYFLESRVLNEQFDLQTIHHRYTSVYELAMYIWMATIKLYFLLVFGSKVRCGHVCIDCVLWNRSNHGRC